MAQRSIDILLNAKDFASAKIDAATGKMIGSAARLGVAFAGVFAAQKIGHFVAESVRMFEEEARAQRLLAATLRSTGHAAGFTAKELSEYASQLQKLSGIEDDVIVGGEGILATFKVGKEVFKEATQAALDMSVRLDTDLKSAAIQVGNALQDPILGITALRRAGANFSADQKEVIKNLVETGNHLEAQKMILAELKTEFGGAAAAGRTASATWKAAFGDLMEALGGNIAASKFWQDGLEQGARFSEQMAAALERGTAAAGEAGWIDNLLHSGFGLLDKFPKDLQAAADAAAELKAEADKPVEVVDQQAVEKAEKLADSIEKLTTKLKEEQATMGMSSHVAEVHKLLMQGATEAQLAEAFAIAKNIDAKEAQKKAQKELFETGDKLIQQLQEGIAAEKLEQLGHTSEAAGRQMEIMRLATQGANDEQIAFIQGLSNELTALEAVSEAEKQRTKDMEQMANAAKQLIERTRTPMQEFQAEMEEAKKLFDEGLLSEAQLAQAGKALRKELTKDTAIKSKAQEAVNSAPLVSRFLTNQPGSANDTTGILRELRAIQRDALRTLKTIERHRVEVQLGAI